MNYTIITSQCKRPDYSPKLCCGAFLEFACPYSEQLNDLTNDCATIMFSYINLNGNYPPGLFANECRGSKEGLDCPADGPSANALGSSANPDENAATVAPAIPAFGVLVMLFLLHVLLF
uniref:GPI-anchored protein LORELEI n=1 Tax=Anthurium amnicola TaxID=1678845 RepID=A0A1D1XV33_9ARAE